MLFDTPPILSQDTELDIDVLGLFFQRCDFSFESIFVDVREFIFGVLRQLFSLLFLTKIARMCCQLRSPQIALGRLA